VTNIVYIGYCQLKKKDSFSFYLSIAMLLVFLYRIAAYASVRQCVIIIVTKKLGIEGEFSNAQMIIYLRRH
jgi:multidrug efflux pump subunit AcrB